MEYLISHKALPTNLPRDLTLLRSSSDMSRKLVPRENYCHKCPGKVPLSEPIVISNKAKIVTIAEVVEGRLQSMIAIAVVVVLISCMMNIVSHSIILKILTFLCFF